MIAIVAPYAHGETTLAAIRLAEELLAMGHEVRYVAAGPSAGHVCPFWDKRIWTSRGDGLCVAAQGCRTVIHFQPSRSLLNRATLVADQAKQVLVPSWHQLRKPDGELVRAYHQIVSPSLPCFTSVQQTFLAGRMLGNPPKWTTFCSGLRPVHRVGVLHDRRVRACLVADGTVIDSAGAQTLQLIRELLMAIPVLSFSLLSTRSWPDSGRKTIQKLGVQFPERFRAVRVGYVPDLTAEFHTHDWAIFPSARWEFGILPSRAADCGAGVIALDVAPLNGILCHGHDAVLIPCKTRLSWNQAPTASATAGALLSTCLTALSDPSVLTAVRSDNLAERIHRIAGFRSTWEAVLEHE